MRATKVWYLGNGPPVSPRLIALPDAYSGAWQGQLVSLRGVVLNLIEMWCLIRESVTVADALQCFLLWPS